MDFKAALLATATAGVLFLIAACGGDGGGGASDSTPSQPDSSGGSSTPAQSQPVSSGGGTPAQSQPVSSGNVGSGTPAQCPVSSGNVGSGTPAQCPVSSGNVGTGTTAKYVTIDLNCSTCSSGGGSGIGDGEQVGSARISGTNHRVLWRGTASSMVDLGSVAEAGAVVATSGGIQVGWYGTDDYDHALKWAGSASSVVDIHPAGLFRESKAFGVASDQIIGYGLTNTYIHALLWTSAGPVDLNPGGFGGSVGLATDGGQQVGYGARTGGIGIGAAAGGNHALLWSGTAESVVDLHPVSGYGTTSANGVSGGQQVGWGGALSSITTLVCSHALLWTGSAQTVVDLHPSGFRESVAYAVAAGRQVGFGITPDGSHHALLWNGTAESVVDLNVFLPPSFTQSSASGIDASGNVIGTATDANAVPHAILWVPQ